MSKLITRTVTKTTYNVFAGTEFAGNFAKKLTAEEINKIATDHKCDVKSVVQVAVESDPVLIGMTEEDFIKAAFIVADTGRKLTDKKYKA